MTSARRHAIIALLIGGLMSLAIAELCLRLFRYEFVPFVSITHLPCIYVKDDSTGFRYRPGATGWIHRHFEIDNEVEINSDGFHDIERPGDAAETESRSIVAIGDSLTASIHVPTENTWTQVLERDLQSPVINLGLDSTGTDVHLRILREHLVRHRPRAVILAFYRNDVEDIRRVNRHRECYRDYVLVFENASQRAELQRMVDENFPSAPVRWIYDRSYSFRLAAFFLHPSAWYLRNNTLSPSAADLPLAEPTAKNGRLDGLLTDLWTLSRQATFDLLIIPVPTKDSISGSLDALRDNASDHVLERLQVIDVAPRLEALLDARDQTYADLFWRFDGHFNVLGYELYGLAVSSILRERKLN